jgi:hypothetical protein
MGAIFDYSSGEARPRTDASCATLNRRKKLFSPQRHSGTEKGAMAEKLSIAK